MEEFPKNLARFMQNGKKSQTALSNETGLSQAAISRYLKGLSTPGAVELCKMATALGVSMDQLWKGESYTERQDGQNQEEAEAMKELQELKHSLRVVFRAMSEPAQREEVTR